MERIVIWLVVPTLTLSALVYLLCGIRWSLLVLVSLCALFVAARWVVNHAL